MSPIRCVIILLLLACIASVGCNQNPAQENEPLTIKIVEPRPGAVVYNPFIVESEVNSLEGISRVEFIVNSIDTVDKTKGPYRILWDPYGYSPGEINISVIAHSLDERQVKDSILVNKLSPWYNHEPYGSLIIGLCSDCSESWNWIRREGNHFFAEIDTANSSNEPQVFSKFEVILMDNHGNAVPSNVIRWSSSRVDTIQFMYEKHPFEIINGTSITNREGIGISVFGPRKDQTVDGEIIEIIARTDDRWTRNVSDTVRVITEIKSIQ